MNIIEGLTAFKVRKNYSNNKLAEVLGCSSSVVSLYLSGKSGLSLDKLAILLKDGMTLEEAFGDEVAAAVKSNMAKDFNKAFTDDSMTIVIDGLQKILDACRGNASKSLASR
ncbi:MAG: hypothetical protein IKP90_05080 [Fibrobacter sp.]|nr:hypothetical protein [Fibrobacter sp.]